MYLIQWFPFHRESFGAEHRFSLVIAVSMRFNRTDRDAFWIPSGWVGRAVKEKAALTSQRHVPSPGSLQFTKSYAKVWEMLYFPLPGVYPCDSTEWSTIFLGLGGWASFLTTLQLSDSEKGVVSRQQDTMGNTQGFGIWPNWIQISALTLIATSLTTQIVSAFVKWRLY